MISVRQHTYLLLRPNALFYGKHLRPDLKTTCAPIHVSPEQLNYQFTKQTSPRICGPSVRNLLHEYAIDYKLVNPTGPHDILLKGDILNYIRNNKLRRQAQKSELSNVSAVSFTKKMPFIDIPLTPARKDIAELSSESKKSSAHSYMSTDCKIDSILEWKNRLNAKGFNVSLNDFLIKCAATSLVSVPDINVVCINNAPVKMESVNITFAVATEGGIITPVLREANTLGVEEISKQVKMLAFKAKEGQLKPEDFQGGSFTISNLGMFGITEFTAVINAPQGAILGVGTSRLCLEEHIRTTRIKITLSYNNTIIDSESAGKFLQCFKQYLENPFHIMI